MIVKEMSIADIVRKYPQAVPVLQSKGLGCLGCIAAAGESIEQGLMAHGLDVDSIVKEMNEAVSGKK